ncbi:MAG: hypothetical protein V3R93_00315 [Candidatus Hydrothermarchaeaceae archaeon]
MRSMKNSADILRPEVSVPALYLAFLLFAFISYRIEDTSRFLGEPTPLTFGLSLFAIPVLIIFIAVGRKMTPHPYILLAVLPAVASLDLYLISIPIIAILFIAGGYAVFLWFAAKRLGDHRLIISLTIILAVISASLVLFNGVPLLDMALRQSIAVTPQRAIFHGSAVIAATMSILFYGKRIFIPVISLLTFMALLLGFKSDAIAILLSAGIAGLLVGKIWLKGSSIILLSIVLILNVIGTYMATATATMADNTWDISPLFYIFYRAGFTLSVFDEIVRLSFPYGYAYGQVLLSPTQEVMGMEVFQYKHIITSTIIGPGMLDFGVPGLILTCAFIGTCLGMMHDLKNKLQVCFYAMALAHTFILIEVGLQLSSILWYLSLLYFSVASRESN